MVICLIRLSSSPCGSTAPDRMKEFTRQGARKGSERRSPRPDCLASPSRISCWSPNGGTPLFSLPPDRAGEPAPGGLHGYCQPVTYDSAFFTSISSTAKRSAANVLPIVFEYAGLPRSVLDLGCGTGAWLAEAKGLGVKDVVGVDGAYVPKTQLQIPSEEFLAGDLAQSIDLGRRFDLTLSVEVAEHLPPYAAENFVESLCRHSDCVLFSAALPGQGGKHHINEKPASYWVALFETQGFPVFDLIRPRVWDSSEVTYYHKQNLLLFGRGEVATRLAAISARAIVDIVHPEQLEYWHQLGVSEAGPLFRAAVGRTLRRRLTPLRNRF